MKLDRLFSFSGRVGIGTFWGVQLLAWVAFGFSVAVALAIHPALAIICYIAFGWIVLANTAKRWHDRGKSGWWALIALVPLIGWIWALVETGFLSGNLVENEYGLQHSGSPFTSNSEEAYYQEINARLSGSVTRV